jgi:phosphogluconate dehydratase
MTRPAPLHPTVAAVTDAICDRSRDSREAYLAEVEAGRRQGGRDSLACGNLAHAFAAASATDKALMIGDRALNLGIVTAYNDMLSAHQPLGTYPELIKAAARETGATAQVAGGVPAMCDGITQGQPGMELSLFSREVVALSTAVALSHNTFDAALLLGVCDKIVPGLMIGALAFGHLPAIFVPAGPMSSGPPNKEKARVRELFAQGLVGRDELLASEMRSYHGPGTCTFYGTANSNQMLMEFMGTHVPGAAFAPPGTPLREALTREAARRAAALARSGEGSLSEVINARAVVNGIVGLLATGGSTNHTLHLVAIAHASGLRLDWADFDALSRATPLLARVYPNGSADVNQFHAAGGLAFVIRELLDAGLLHEAVTTTAGPSLRAYAQEPHLQDGRLSWREAAPVSLDPEIVRGADDPFDQEGGLRILEGNLGRSVIKTSAVDAARRIVEAPAAVFESQEAFMAAFKSGALDRDVVVVVRGQGPRANGMPELHALTPALTTLQAKGRRVALVTDGRMSGASGAIPAAIHLTPEAADEGPIARLRDGDIIRLDAAAGRLDVRLEPEALMQRPLASVQASGRHLGRKLFAPFRGAVGPATSGASFFSV